jgi:hypothetical protein
VKLTAALSSSTPTVVIAAIVAVLVCSPSATADDYGPHPILRDLRGSAPILLAHFVQAPVLSDAVIEGSEAIVMWQAAGKPGLATFRRRNDRWWIVGVFDLFGPAVKQQPQEWVKTLSVSPAMVARAEQHVSGFDSEMPIARPFERPACARCGSNIWNSNDGFETTLTFDAATPTWDPTFTILGRAPTVAEMPPTPHMNAFYFFSIITKGAQPVTLKYSTLDVWFPYVLDAKQKYSLLLGFVNPNIEDVPGALSDNTLTFTLPAFATVPGKDALGEIDGDFP